ncbi:MAG TPA: nitroreductase [Elusimicrobia bacterium]|jgi:nitroreductase|nr:nitroreductase [Elusimicrobiota bacterium]
MDVYQAVVQRRTIRRFRQKPIPSWILKKLVNAARLAPSAGNRQPCEYIIINEKAKINEVFTTLHWAGYISPEGNPPLGQRPKAYIIVLLNTQKSKKPDLHDASASIENIILVAWEEGIGSCWIGSVNRRRLRKILNVPDYCKIDSVVALGYPAERPVVEKVSDSIKYWKDKYGILHVPKRNLKEILYWNTYTGGLKNG